MRGYVEVERCDLLSAVIGFEMRYDAAKELQREAINRYYDKHYVNGSWWSRLGNSKKTPREFARGRISSFGMLIDVLDDVIDNDEYHELYWYTWTRDTEVDPIKSLYKASSLDSNILLDQDMAKFVVKYKNYLENNG